MIAQFSSSILKCALKNVRITSTCSMYEHPYLEYYKQKRDHVPSNVAKKTTGLTGLFVDENPHFNLNAVYKRLLKVLEKMPENYVYRQNTEQIVYHRLQLLQKEKDVEKLEEQIGMGQIEEVRLQAEYELETARELLNSRAWEPLIERQSEAQWRWPIH